MNDVTGSSNVILIEDEPGNYADILRKNLKPDRAEQDKTSTVFLFVTSSLRPQLLYVGQLWFNQVGWHFRRVDGSPLPEPQGTHEFIVLPRLPKDLWTEAHGFLWRFPFCFPLFINHPLSIN